MARRKAAKDPVTQYARDVVDGKVVAGRLVRLACERHLRDLERGEERGLYWDPEAAQHALDFFRFLRQSKGEWAGAPLQLQPWQQFAVGSVFGWMREATDGGRYRRYRTAYNEVSRKNGKSTLGAGIGLYLLDADGEPGAEVYSAATVKDQAKIVWREAMQMVRKSPALRRRIQMVGTGPKSQGANMFVPDTASKFEPLGADVDSLDGLNVHGAIVDELHAHKTRAMWDVLETATAARRQPLIWAITTAGFNRDGICYELREYSVQVLEGLVQDDRWFAFIATIDEGDDPFDETIWIKANPNLGISVKLDDLRSLVLKAKQIPAALNNFHVPRQHGGRWQPRLVYVHEGWRDGPDGRRQLVRAQYFGGLEDSQELWSTVWDYLDRHYDLEHVAAIFVAGDGAGWIRKGCEYMPKSVFVLDRYHVHKQLSEALGADPERRRAVWRALDSLNAREVQRLLREAYQQADSDYRRQAIRRTATYLRRNWDGIRAWRRWEGIWHGCSAEGHVSHVYAARLSSRPMAWSRAGVHTMAQLRVLQANGGSASAAYLHGKARPPLQVSSRWMEQLREEVETGRLLPAETLDNLPALRGHRTPLTRALRALSQSIAV